MSSVSLDSFDFILYTFDSMGYKSKLYLLLNILEIGHWVPMCALIALGFVTASEKDLAIFLLVVAVGINSATYLGFQVSAFASDF